MGSPSRPSNSHLIRLVRDMRTLTPPTDEIPPLPLPRIRGPKLEPFRGTATADLEFIRYIGSEEDVDSKVWKVKVDGEYYALKIVSQRTHRTPSSHPAPQALSRSTDPTLRLNCQFPFQYWVGLQKTSGSWIIAPEYDEEGRPPLTPQDYIDYLDPFHNECRVYGRLKQEKQEEIAVRAHGYVLLTPEQERHVTEPAAQITQIPRRRASWTVRPCGTDGNGIDTSASGLSSKILWTREHRTSKSRRYPSYMRT